LTLRRLFPAFLLHKEYMSNVRGLKINKRGRRKPHIRTGITGLAIKKKIKDHFARTQQRAMFPLLTLSLSLSLSLSPPFLMSFQSGKCIYILSSLSRVSASGNLGSSAILSKISCNLSMQSSKLAICVRFLSDVRTYSPFLLTLFDS